MITVAAVALVVLGHQPMLRGFYSLLVAEPVAAVSQCERAVLLFGDPGCVRHVKKLISEKIAAGVLVVQPKHRAVEIGAVPSLADVTKSQLEVEGIKASSFDVVVSKGRTTYESIAALDAWMRLGNCEQVLIVCPRHQTRYLQTVIDTVIPESRRSAIRLSSVGPDGFDENRWWKNPTGIKRVGGSFVRLVHALCIGEPIVSTQEWSPEQYELWLKNITEKDQGSGVGLAG